MTTTVRELISVTLADIHRLPNRFDKASPLIYIVMKWLSTLSSDVDYSTDVDIYLRSKSDIIYKPIDNSESVRNLLTKHRVFDIGTSCEIEFGLDYSSLYTLMSILNSPNIRFAVFGHVREMLSSPNVILVNHIRMARVIFRRYVITIANREDITDDRLIRDHALLSSLTLVYTMMLICVLLDYEARTTMGTNIGEAVNIFRRMLHRLEVLLGTSLNN